MGCVKRSATRFEVPVVLLALGIAAPAPRAASAADAPSPETLGPLSIEDLASIEVSWVTKTAEPLSDAAAAIYVITHTASRWKKRSWKCSRGRSTGWSPKSTG